MSALKFLARRGPAARFGVLAACALALCAPQAAATQEEADFLQLVAEQYVLAQFPEQDDSRRISVKASRLDPKRDYGGRCLGYLTAQLQSPKIKNSATVKINCSRPDASYTLYVPVDVSVMRRSLVAAENIPKGTVITRSLLEIRFIDETSIPSSVITDPAMILGSKVRRDIAIGSPIHQGSFCVVCKGDNVTIEAKTSNLAVKTIGTALEDGNLDEQISVRNSSSKKVIEAVVTGPGAVEVRF